MRAATDITVYEAVRRVSRPGPLRRTHPLDTHDRIVGQTLTDAKHLTRRRFGYADQAAR